ncbi:NACHT domain-containing protein [Haliangium sp.]|uniref:NACHT domain-containing protein n=1 Tax=Haliangium sp. TaxID=2663208 RepID=UPI003D0B7F95
MTLVHELVTIQELGDGLDVWIVLSDYPRALAAIRERVAAQVPVVVYIEPGDDVTATLLGGAREWARGPRRPLLWVQQACFDAVTWRRSLARINQQRSSIAQALDAVLVLAGPLGLLEPIQSQAPDVSSLATTCILRDAPVRRIERTRVCWLHMAGLQITAEASPPVRERFDGLERCWTEQPLPRPDFVCVSGDVARFGRREEYLRAEAILSGLGDRLGLDPARRWFVAPGNHDVDRTRIHKADELLLRSARDPGSLSELMRDGEGMRLLGRRLGGFYEFTHRFLGPARGWYAEEPWRTDVVDLDGLRVAVLQMNSAWAGGLEGERGRLLLGEHQVAASLLRADGAHLRLALMHHSLDHVAEFDRERVAAPLRAGVALVLCGSASPGRREAPAQGPMRDVDGVPELVAYDPLPGLSDDVGVQLIDIDLASGRGLVWVLGRGRDDRGAWLVRAGPTGASAGRFAVRAAALTPLDAVVSSSSAPVTRDRRARLIADYRRAAAAVHGTIRFLGVAADAPRAARHGPDLYVPPTLETLHSHPVERHLISTPALLGRLCPGSDAVARLVVLGPAGSGKSTLCRYLALRLAGVGVDTADAEEARTVTVPVDLLPLRASLRDYQAALDPDPTLSIVDFLDRQAENELAVPLPPGFLREHLSQGRAVLLLDGLDEVGGPSQRALVRDRVQALARAFPRVSMVVTSREAGYHQVALDADPEHGFEQVWMAPFSDDDIDALVHVWYRLTLPDDTREQRRRVADLTARLRAEPRARDLARRPLLATLLALVHYHRVELPSQRVHLYQACIDVLLTTWPAQHGWRFDEVEIAVQRRCLEDLALAVQESRRGWSDIVWEEDDDSSEAEQRGQPQPRLLDVALQVFESEPMPEIGVESDVSVSREDMAAVVAALLAGADAREDDAEARAGLAKRWLRFLEEDAGLLVASRTDRLSFCHLALLEYLAACALVRHADTRVVDAVLSRYRLPAWYEVCLLTLGVVGSNRAVADGLCERLLTGDGHDAPGDGAAQALDRCFLLDALLEGIDVHDQHRLDIVRGAADLILRDDTTADDSSLIGLPEDVRAAVDRLIRFSPRHGRPIEAWLERSLTLERGADLRRALALRGNDASALDLLARRGDVDAAAVVALDVWPEQRVGRWAAAHCSTAAGLRWALERGGQDQAQLRAYDTLRGPDAAALAGAMSIVVAQRARDFATLAAGCAHDLIHRMRPGGRGLPGAARLDQARLPIVPRLPPLEQSNIRLTAPLWSRPSRSARWHDGMPRLGPADFERAFAPSFLSTRYIDESRLEFMGGDLRITVSKLSPVLSDADLALAPFLQSPPPYREPMVVIAAPLSLVFSSLDADAASAARFRLDDGASSPTAPAPSEPRPGRTVDDALDPVEVVRLTAEALIADLTTVELSDQDIRLAYLLHRLQCRLQCRYWTPWERRLPPTFEPGQEAAYLALGWAQCTITAEWPDTDRWRALLSGPAPTHWLPRAHWHLCWLLHTPEQDEHLRGYADALALGRGDQAYPDHAIAMPQPPYTGDGGADQAPT